MVPLIGTKIAQLREERGWKQKELAVRAGIKQGHLSQIENNKRKPGTPTLRKLIKALGANFNVLDDVIDELPGVSLDEFLITPMAKELHLTKDDINQLRKAVWLVPGKAATLTAWYHLAHAIQAQTDS